MKIEHVGIAVSSLEDAVANYADSLGLEVSGYEDVEDQGVRVAMLPVGDSRIELIAPLGPGSPIEKFLEKRGPGIHHIAVGVDDIEGTLARLEARGARLIDRVPRPGAGNTRVAFVHPSSMNGVLLELVEHGK